MPNDEAAAAYKQRPARDIVKLTATVDALRRRSRWRTLLKGGLWRSDALSAVNSWKHRQPIASLGNPANVLLSPASLSRHQVALAKPNLRLLQASSRRVCSSGSIPVASATSGVIDQNQRLFRPCRQTAKAPRYQVLVLCGGGLPRVCQANSGPIYEGHAEECLRSGGRPQAACFDAQARKCVARGFQKH